ncbi:hypothetical protein ACJX0J_009613, partial [Zea mays]
FSVPIQILYALSPQHSIGDNILWTRTLREKMSTAAAASVHVVALAALQLKIIDEQNKFITHVQPTFDMYHLFLKYTLIFEDTTPKHSSNLITLSKKRDPIDLGASIAIFLGLLFRTYVGDAYVRYIMHSSMYTPVDVSIMSIYIFLIYTNSF